jgi:3-oxoadipate enol-lactonase
MPIADNGLVRLHYETSGSASGEVLLFSNSLGSSLRMWDKVVARFETTHRLVRFDTRGHGRSGIPPGPYTIHQLGSDLLFLLDHLDIQRANLCGLSLGGMLAMWMGIHAPHRLLRIILANTGARILTPELWDQRIASVQNSGTAPLAAASLERWFTPAYRRDHPAEMDEIRDMIAATDPRGYAACCAILRDTDLQPHISAIRTPALVITGTHDPATPPADGRALHAAIPNSQYVELDASHLSAWERADEFADTVLAFLKTEVPGNG